MAANVVASREPAVVSLAELAELNPESLGSGTPGNSRFRYVDLGSADRGRIDWSSVREYQFAAAPSRARRVVEAGDVLFGTVRPGLQSHAAIPAGCADGRIVASTGFSVIRARPGKADPRFLFHFVMSDALKRQAERVAVGSNYPAVNESDVRRLEFPCFAFSDQRTVAEILDTADDSIRKTEQVIVKLRLVKLGLIQDLLARGVDDNGEVRSPHRHPERFKQSPLGRIPGNWQLSSLGDLSSLVTSGSRGWGPYYAERGALFMRIGNLTREHINLKLDKVVHVVPPGTEGTRTRLEPGDVLVSITADLGIIGVVPPGLGDAYVNQHIALVRVDASRANGRWIAHYLAGPRAQALIRRLDDPGAKAGLNLPAVRGLVVAMPPPAEQDELATRLDAADAAVAREKECLAKLHLLKAGLMGDLLTGSVAVESVLEGVRS